MKGDMNKTFEVGVFTWNATKRTWILHNTSKVQAPDAETAVALIRASGKTTLAGWEYDYLRNDVGLDPKLFVRV
jgi:hypothetical protein